MILGVHMTLMIGPTIAVPAPLAITESLASVEVTQTDSGRSGFQLTFHVGRSGPWDLPDYRLLLNPLLRPFNRVVVMVRFNLTPTVLIDGFITQFQLTPSQQPGGSTLVVTGEDVSVMMDPRADGVPVPDAGDRAGADDPGQVRRVGLVRHGHRPAAGPGPGAADPRDRHPERHGLLVPRGARLPAQLRLLCAPGPAAEHERRVLGAGGARDRAGGVGDDPGACL